MQNREEGSGNTCVGLESGCIGSPGCLGSAGLPIPDKIRKSNTHSGSQAVPARHVFPGRSHGVGVGASMSEARGRTSWQVVPPRSSRPVARWVQTGDVEHGIDARVTLAVRAVSLHGTV